MSLSRNLYFARRGNVVLAEDIDNHEIVSLNSDIEALFEHIIGGREVYRYSPEIKLVTCVVYLGFSLIGTNCTSGQDYCNITLVCKNSVEAGGQQKGYKSVHLQKQCTLVFLSAILPYIYSRLGYFVQLIKNEIHILTTDETIDSYIESPLYSQGQPIINSRIFQYDTASGTFTSFSTATMAAKLKDLFSFVENIHQYAFYSRSFSSNRMSNFDYVTRLLKGGRFYSISYRIANIEQA